MKPYIETLLVWDYMIMNEREREKDLSKKEEEEEEEEEEEKKEMKAIRKYKGYSCKERDKLQCKRKRRR